MRRVIAVVLLGLAACSGVENCTQLAQEVLLAYTLKDDAATKARLGELWLVGEDMRAAALARGADGEALLCAQVSQDAFDRSQAFP